MNYEKPCIRRQKQNVIDREGSRSVAYVCTHLACDQFGKPVTPEVCSGCLLSVEKAAKIEHDDVAAYPPCIDRTVETVIPLCCGGPTEKFTCASETAPDKGLMVLPTCCCVCNHKRTNPNQ